MFPKHLTRELVQAAEELQRCRLWERFTNFHCFGVRVPGEDHPLLVSVMGAAGEEHGLMLLRGPNAVDTFLNLLDSDGPGDDAAEALDMLGFSMDPFDLLVRESKALIRRSGRQPASGEIVPNFLVKRPHRHARTPDDDELMLMLQAIKAAVAAERLGLLTPAEADDDAGVCMVAAEDNPDGPAVSVTRQPFTRESTVAKPAVFAASGVDLTGMKRLSATWLVGTPGIPLRVKNDDRNSLLLLVADDANMMVLKAEPFFSDETPKQVDCLVRLFRERGLPRNIIFASRPLFDALTPVVHSAGVTCLHKPSDPRLAEVIRDFLDLLGGGAPTLDDYADELDPLDDTVPAADDLAGWKRADHLLSLRFADHLAHGERPQAPRAIKRYFGDDQLEHHLHKHEHHAVVMAYSSWCMLDYRPTRNSQTQAEIMLEAGLPRAQAMLLEARMKAHPTIFRVTGHDASAGTIDLEDVLLGGEVKVHDKLLSQNINDGLFLSARAFPAGKFHFFEVIGPPLGAMMGMRAVKFLQGCGLQVTPEGLRHGAHLFGSLWGWIEEYQANRRPPRLCNTDGDDLLLHTASFRLADPDATRKALRKRKDIDLDEDAGEFVWFKPTGRGAKMLGGPVTLGRIEFIGDELVLTVNSARRFADARKWLTKLPGVTFNNVTTRQADAGAMSLTPDDQRPDAKPLKITPQMTGALQVQINEQYMAWLDTALPILKGKTPRQVCRTPEGKEHIAMMIRTIPDPMGDVPIRVPRQEMLRELGLPATATATAPPPEPATPSPAAPSALKVGRNEPCPCGSGRKYKKCCGK